MAEKLDKYGDVLKRLVMEAAACTPAEWTKGTLTISSDGTRINYRLKNEEEPGKAAISDLLRELIDELYLRMAHEGDVWTEAVVAFALNGSNLSFNTTFQYAEPTPVEEPARGKPWWKVWQR